VTGLLLPDAPLVVWWPNAASDNTSESPIGKSEARRIKDSLNQSDFQEFLKNLSLNYAEGDSDFAWTRLTLWRAQFAALLDQPPHETVVSVDVIGDLKYPSVLLLAAWLMQQLRVPVLLEHGSETVGVQAVYLAGLNRADSSIKILRNQSNIAVFSQSNQPLEELSLPVRSWRDCLSQDPRRLDPDLAFKKVISVDLGVLLEDQQ
jgi:glucose-6-phosphate dehydrogenase assembly protein OpcA